ncbi:MAG: hypothetical protein HY356_06660 [Gammaproteobacteria bacterium]|nr:hypothetical protein [Gammaproteobacteria bacterium]
MTNPDLNVRIREARAIAEHLQHLLYEDAMHRLELYHKYARDPDANKWSPDLHKRCQLVNTLRKKLEVSA